MAVFFFLFFKVKKILLLNALEVRIVNHFKLKEI